MRFFFRSRQFRIIITVFLVVAIISLSFAFVGSRMTPFTDVAGIITAPFRNAYTVIESEISDFVTAYRSGNELMIKNSELSSEINELREKVAEYDKTKSENEFYKKYLGIKEENPDFKFTPATVISHDGLDQFGGFTINKGSASNIKVRDIVISDEGLVGIVSELGTTTAKITTVLSPEVTLGALDGRTNDSGIVSGNIQLSEDNLCRFSNLSRSCSVAIGDYVVSSGEGIFPDGILIGTVSNIGSDKYNNSIYADIVPFVNFKELRNVMIITDFNGKGGLTPAGDK
ncbi:MAG: rod shape-determining protein MreC [Clostridia bacterium]|nr:rod shape-determining protein MreC [Clostridia bacterium]